MAAKDAWYNCPIQYNIVSYSGFPCGFSVGEEGEMKSKE